MAKVKGPFLSQSASGSIAKRLTARTTARGAVVLAYSRPGSRNPAVPSQAQLDHRAIYGALVADWHALTQEQRDQYNADAVPLAISGWNLFMQQNIGAPVAGTVWDGSSTTWDGGATAWDI